MTKSWSVMKIVDKKVITMQLIESPCVMQTSFLNKKYQLSLQLSLPVHVYSLCYHLPISLYLYFLCYFLQVVKKIVDLYNVALNASMEHK